MTASYTVGTAVLMHVAQSWMEKIDLATVARFGRYGWSLAWMGHSGNCTQIRFMKPIIHQHRPARKPVQYYVTA